MKKGFTLAEVLITLTIIGVVAAMTIPTLIANYQKRVFSSRLSQTFSVLSNAVKMAQIKYGDVAYWGYQKYYGTTVDPNDGNSEYIKEYAEKYFLPYLKVSKNYGEVKLKDIGYSRYKSKDGKTYFSAGEELYTVELNNGTTLFFNYNGVRRDDVAYRNDPVIYIDVNGKKNPNITGQDFFAVRLSSTKNRLETAGVEYSRSRLLNLCSKRSDGNYYDNIYCTALIQMDGWEFAEDHPW